MKKFESQRPELESDVSSRSSLPVGFGPESELSLKQNLLLMRYVDAECGVLARWRAERLLRRSSQARSFVAELSTLRTQCRSSLESFAPLSPLVDFPTRVDTRIEEERRLAMLLGERRISAESETRSWLRSLFGERIDLRYAVAGSVSAAILLTLFIRFASPFVQGTTGAADGNQQLAAASSGAQYRTVSDAGPGIRLIQDRIPVASSVEWIRGGGRIELVQIPDNVDSSTPVIWIKRRPQQALARSSRGLSQSRVQLSEAYALSRDR